MGQCFLKTSDTQHSPRRRGLQSSHPGAPDGKAGPQPPGLREGEGQQPPAATRPPWGELTLREHTAAGHTRGRTGDSAVLWSRFGRRSARSCERFMNWCKVTRLQKSKASKHRCVLLPQGYLGPLEFAKGPHERRAMTQSPG